MLSHKHVDTIFWPRTYLVVCQAGINRQVVLTLRKKVARKWNEALDRDVRRRARGVGVPEV
eukprot:1759007-Pleurochrysis_carterae.AAC.1